MADTESMPELTFEMYIMMLSSSAMLYLGKIANPTTGKTERNLDLAKFHIDILRMLKEKTKGNISPAEATLLGSTVTNLELNYVDEKSRPADVKDDAPPAGGSPST
ncbi:MAG: DUF1844 domain-containing protein [Spirochaetota bacterium]